MKVNIRSKIAPKILAKDTEVGYIYESPAGFMYKRTDLPYVFSYQGHTPFEFLGNRQGKTITAIAPCPVGHICFLSDMGELELIGEAIISIVEK